jgi:hypothetical protein
MMRRLGRDIGGRIRDMGDATARHEYRLSTMPWWVNLSPFFQKSQMRVFTYNTERVYN